MKRNIWIGIGIIVIVALAIVLIVTQTKKALEEIKIGVITPLTGGAAKYGEDLKRGYDLAVEEINGKGGVNGAKIKLIYEDSEAQPPKAVSAARKLIDRDKIVTILGGFGSSATLAVAPIAENKKVVLLSSASSSPKVTDAGDYIFRNEISDRYGAKETARLFFDLGFRKIGVLFINNDFGIDFCNMVQKTYKELAGTVTAAETFEQDAKDLRTQLMKIKESDPKAILIVSYKEAILILKQMRELGIRKQILSTALFEDPEILEKVGDIAEGAIYTYYGTFDTKSQDVRIREFIKNFRKKYGVDPEYYAPIGYDAVKILALAIEKGGFKPEQIKNALYQIKDFPGLSGTTSFDENGDVVKPVILKMVKNGKFVKYD